MRGRVRVEFDLWCMGFVVRSQRDGLRREGTSRALRFAEPVAPRPPGWAGSPPLQPGRSFRTTSKRSERILEVVSGKG